MLRWNGRLRLSANLRWLFTESPDAERVGLAKEAGFGGVEIAVPYLYPAAELATRVRDAELDVVLINTPAGAPGSPTAWGAACLPDQTEAFRRGIEAALAYAVELRADYIHVLGGQRPAGLTHEIAYATYLDNIAWASRQAAATDVTLLLEAINQVDVPGFVLRSVSDALEVIEAIGRSHVRALLDVYHCQMNGEDVADRIQRSLPLIAHIQVADAPGRHEPGTGDVRWHDLFDELLASSYTGWIGCEYRPTSTTIEGLGWTRAVGRDVRTA